MERKRIAEATKGVGRPKVGGPFELVDQDGEKWNSEEKMRGRYCLVYFGFSHCPDICPEELDKMVSSLFIIPAELFSRKGVWVEILEFLFRVEWMGAGFEERLMLQFTGRNDRSRQ